MNDIPLNTWIVKHFPTDFNLFESSFEYRILCKLLAFHLFSYIFRWCRLQCSTRSLYVSHQSLTDTFCHDLLERGRHPSESSYGWVRQKVKQKCSRVQYATIGWLEYCYSPHFLRCTECSHRVSWSSQRHSWGLFFVTCFLSIINEKIVLSKQNAISSNRKLNRRWLHCASWINNYNWCRQAAYWHPRYLSLWFRLRRIFPSPRWNRLSFIIKITTFSDDVVNSALFFQQSRRIQCMAHTCVTGGALQSQRLLSKKQKIIHYYHKENQVSQSSLIN